jgi:hypothetical protein
MKNKIKKQFGRLELADHLKKFAAQLRNGTFETDGRQWTIPEAFVAKIKHKDKKASLRPSSNGAGPLWLIMSLPPEKKSPAGRSLLKPKKVSGKRIQSAANRCTKRQFPECGNPDLICEGFRANGRIF